MNAYEKLTDIYQRVDDLRHVYSIASWDEAAMMPKGGGSARGQALATLGVFIHDLVVDGNVGALLDACSNTSLDPWQVANVREIRREYNEMTVLSSSFIHAQSLAKSNCEQAWRVHRTANDWPAFVPYLEEVVRFSVEEAGIRSVATGLSKYDAMLDTFEPGMRCARLDELFAGLKKFLPGFTDKVLSLQAKKPLLAIGSHFDINRQRELGLKVMATIGFDFNHGRLDISHHPFCGGVQQDVRITTRYTTDNFIESLMAVIHETGHALYEQGRPKDFPGQPVSRALSSGVHESQSLLMEMQVARSKQFLQYLAPVIRAEFSAGEHDAAWGNENLLRLLNNVERGLIRVDADEVTYPLHIILRYEIERGLIEGSLQVADIPEVWDSKMLVYLGRDTRGNFADGCMQDVHWPASLFGYFPTYTLGALMAAQIFASARQTIPDLMGNIALGNFAPLINWLRVNVHGHGSFYSVDDLLMHATGEQLNESYFIQHLTERYGG